VIYGVLADTKTLLTPHQIQALKKAFKGVDGILHAGPVGEMPVLEQLKKIAPVKAVCGNAENSIVRSDVPVTLAWRAGVVVLGMTHGYGKPVGLKAHLLRQFEEEKEPVRVIVYGRNFDPVARQAGDHFFFNPGSFLGTLPEGQHGRTGPSRVGLLFIHGKKVDGHLLTLDR
jgi:putative phosphoesterase